MAATRPNQRLRCDHGLRRPALVRSLLTDVFQGRLRAGQHLVAAELAKRFGVSQTPIREALIELAGMGLVDLVPNRGAIVRRVTPRDMREIWQVRRVLECAAVRTACGRLDPGELRGLADEFRRLGAAVLSDDLVQQARAVDSQLHDLIAASCGNAFLAKELNRLQALFRACRDVAWEHDQARQDFHRLGEEFQEHLAIVDALLAGDAREASRAMARHIRSGGRYWSRAVADRVNK